MLNINNVWCITIYHTDTDIRLLQYTSIFSNFQYLVHIGIGNNNIAILTMHLVDLSMWRY